MSEHTGADRTAERIVLALYLLLLVWVILLKLHVSDFGDLPGRRALNLVPFGGTGDLHGLGSREIALNVLAFVPLGVLVYLASRRRDAARMVLPIVATTLAFEVIQYAFGIGASDITDALTNTVGGLIGLGIAWAGLRVFGPRAQRALLVGLVVVLVALAAGAAAWLLTTGVRFRL